MGAAILIRLVFGTMQSLKKRRRYHTTNGRLKERITAARVSIELRLWWRHFRSEWALPLPLPPGILQRDEKKYFFIPVCGCYSHIVWESAHWSRWKGIVERKCEETERESGGWLLWKWALLLLLLFIVATTRNAVRQWKCREKKRPHPKASAVLSGSAAVYVYVDWPCRAEQSGERKK